MAYRSTRKGATFGPCQEVHICQSTEGATPICAQCVGGKEKCFKKSIPEASLSDCLSAVTIQRRVLHELLVGGLGDEEDPSQNEFLQLSRNI